MLVGSYAACSPCVRDDLELVDRSFISDNFKRREADIIYRVKVDRQGGRAGSEGTNQPQQDVYVYVITEFQSTVDKSIPVRLQLYISMLHDLLLRNGHKGNLPVVLPIVLYTGTKPWTIPENTTKLIGHGVLLEYIFPFKYYCLEERNISEERAKQLKGVYAAITIIVTLRCEDSAMCSVFRRNFVSGSE